MNYDPNTNNPFDQDDSSNSTSVLDNTDMKPIEEDTGTRPLTWMILGFAALCCGLIFAGSLFYFKPDSKSLMNQYFPSPTATASPTPNWTATAQVLQVTATAQSIQTAVADANTQWQVSFADPFDSNTNDWSTGNDDDEWADITRTIENGIYVWDVTSKKGFIGWVGAETGIATDFYLAVDVIQTSGPTSDTDYGLTYREDTRNNFYYFGVDNLGFRVSLSYGDEWLDVIDWTASNAIRTDGPNRLAVIAKGSHFIFLINDQVVGEADDDHLRAGTPGLAIQVHGTDQKITFQFDNFEMRKP